MWNVIGNSILPSFGIEVSGKNDYFRLVRTTAILLQPVTRAVHFSKNRKVPNIAIQCISCWLHQNHWSLDSAIAPGIRLHPSSCGPGFESNAQHLRFFNLHCWNWYNICYWKVERTKINKKSSWSAQFLKNGQHSGSNDGQYRLDTWWTVKSQATRSGRTLTLTFALIDSCMHSRTQYGAKTKWYVLTYDLFSKLLFI